MITLMIIVMCTSNNYKNLILQLVFKNIIEYLPLSNVIRRFIFLSLSDPQWVSPLLWEFHPYT